MGLGLDELVEFGGAHHLRRRCAGRHDIVVEEERMVLRIAQGGEGPSGVDTADRVLAGAEFPSPLVDAGHKESAVGTR